MKLPFIFRYGAKKTRPAFFSSNAGGQAVQRGGATGQPTGHTQTATVKGVGQFQARSRIAVDFPRALAGEGDRSPAHETDHVLKWVPQKSTHLVREGPVGEKPRLQFCEDRFRNQRRGVACPGQNGSEVSSPEQRLQSLGSIDEEQDRRPPVDQLPGDKASVAQKLLSVPSPEKIEILSTAPGPADDINQIPGFFPRQQRGRF
jgi:hypothetical protein